MNTRLVWAVSGGLAFGVAACLAATWTMVRSPSTEPRGHVHGASDFARAASSIRHATEAFLASDRCAIVSSNGTRSVEAEWEPDAVRFGWRSVTPGGETITDEPSGGFDGAHVWIDVPAFGHVQESGAPPGNWLPSSVTTESKENTWPEGYGPNAVVVLRDLRAGRFKVTDTAGSAVHIEFGSGRIARVELADGSLAAVELVRVERRLIVEVTLPSYSSNVWIRARKRGGDETPVRFALPDSRPTPELPKARAARVAMLSWLHASDPADERLLQAL